MAHVVGVPKRDPCHKCKLPVFLAERLMVGQKVYHRTCLKCARCGSQLTPGSFYETETDDQYCCETCPDEEVIDLKNEVVTESRIEAGAELLSKFESESLLFPLTTKSSRNSVKDRLAFFEKTLHSNVNDEDPSDRKFMQNSVSDEEKSKSLQRTESLTSYKMSSALNNFLSDTIIGSDDKKENVDENGENKLQESGDLSTQNNEETEMKSNKDIINDASSSVPPELPKTSPPQELDLAEDMKHVPAKRFTASTQLILSDGDFGESSTDVEVNKFILLPSPRHTQEQQLQLATASSHHDLDKNEIEPEHMGNEEMTITSEGNIKDLDFSQNSNNNNDCTTKDRVTVDTQNAAIKVEISEQNEEKSINNVDNETTKDKIVTADMRTTSTEKEDKETTERLSVVRTRLQQFEVIEKTEIENVDTKEEEKVNSVSFEIKNVEDECEINDDESRGDQILASSIEIKDDEKKDNEKRLTPHKTVSKKSVDEYPKDLDPFKSDEDDESEVQNISTIDDREANKENVSILSQKSSTSKLSESYNPFDSSDDEIELEKYQHSKQSSTPKIPPPRPPPPRISRNPFDEQDNDKISLKSGESFSRRSSLNSSQSRKTPIPTPRINKSQSQNPTPEPTPRLSTKINLNSTSPSTTSQSASLVLQYSKDLYGSTSSLLNTTPNHLLRNSDIRRSNSSLNFSSGGTIRSRKSRRAPLPPVPAKELFPSNETINSSSITSTPSSSTVGTPKSSRKKRPAPPPPKPARLDSIAQVLLKEDAVETQSKNSISYPLQSELDSKLSDEEKALLGGKKHQELFLDTNIIELSTVPPRNGTKRLIPLDKELMEEHGSVTNAQKCVNISHCDDFKEQHQNQKALVGQEEETNVVYRRLIAPPDLGTPNREDNPLLQHLNRTSSMGERQMKKIKDNKEAKNRNRQSQISVASSGTEDNDTLFNKSLQGKWKRRKGPAPALPIPPRRVLQMLPLQEIKHELEIIEVQQQGLEKQGVILEKMIRDRCEGQNGELLDKSAKRENIEANATTTDGNTNPKEVEYLILQLFELVNEKNDLFRRQAELMYLRRQHRLEQEQADLEYEIRVLMAQPERNKTDSDKAREEALIERLVELVQLRNEVVDCLEMDRIREIEEDQSIKQRLESHIAKRDEEEMDAKKSEPNAKLSKKEKKKQKEAKKVSKSKKIDADKDADETEMGDKQKNKKKRKIFLF